MLLRTTLVQPQPIFWKILSLLPIFIFLMIYDWNISDADNIASPFKVGWLLPKGKNVEKHTEVFPSIEFFFRLFISYQFEISFAVSILFHCHRLIERIKDIRTTAVCVCIHWGITSYKEWQGNVNFFPTLHFSFAIIFYYENILLWCCYLCIEWICRDNVDEMRIYSMLRWQANGNG